MIKHISQLHISDSFVEESIDENSIDDELPSTSYHVNMTSQELEDRLKNAQKITIAEQFKNSFKESENEIIPKLLLDRTRQKPSCQSLVVWKPPIIPSYLLSQDSNSATSDEENYTNENRRQNEDANNNNNNVMEFD